jgi:hypothetical protein
MQFPTDAYIRGVTNAANIQAEGQARMGQQIGEGIQKAAGAYKQYSDAKSDYNATQAMLRSPSYFKLFGLDKESAAELSKDLANTQGEAGYSAANKVFSQLADPLIKYAEIGKRFSQEQDLIGLRNNAAIQQAAIAEYLKLKAIPSPGGGTSAQPSVGPTPQPTPVTSAPVVQPERKKSPWEDYEKKN